MRPHSRELETGLNQAYRPVHTLKDDRLTTQDKLTLVASERDTLKKRLEETQDECNRYYKDEKHYVAEVQRLRTIINELGARLKANCDSAKAAHQIVGQIEYTAQFSAAHNRDQLADILRNVQKIAHDHLAQLQYPVRGEGQGHRTVTQITDLTPQLKLEYRQLDEERKRADALETGLQHISLRAAILLEEHKRPLPNCRSAWTPHVEINETDQGVRLPHGTY